MDMPNIVTMYFDADRHNDADALLKTFADDAVVEDENARHQGSVAIRQWWLAAKKASQYVVEPLEATMDGDRAFIRVRVSGQFPGSPLMLTHAFTIRGNRIIRLKIRP
jgi:ketosteroid isomerase-like protein